MGGAIVGWAQSVDTNHRVTIDNCHVEDGVINSVYKVI